MRQGAIADITFRIDARSWREQIGNISQFDRNSWLIHFRTAVKSTVLFFEATSLSTLPFCSRHNNCPVRQAGLCLRHSRTPPMQKSRFRHVSNLPWLCRSELIWIIPIEQLFLIPELRRFHRKIKIILQFVFRQWKVLWENVEVNSSWIRHELCQCLSRNRFNLRNSTTLCLPGAFLPQRFLLTDRSSAAETRFLLNHNNRWVLM